MPITEGEWASIRSMVEIVSAEVSGNRASYFTTGKVIKRDEKTMCVWIEDFGDQPIPVVSYEYEVKYYDETPKGTTAVAAGNSQPSKTRVNTVQVKCKLPKVGDTVFVAREMGTRRLPRCLGVILGKNWIVAESE